MKKILFILMFFGLNTLFGAEAICSKTFSYARDNKLLMQADGYTTSQCSEIDRIGNKLVDAYDSMIKAQDAYNQAKYESELRNETTQEEIEAKKKLDLVTEYYNQTVGDKDQLLAKIEKEKDSIPTKETKKQAGGDSSLKNIPLPKKDSNLNVKATPVKNKKKTTGTTKKIKNTTPINISIDFSNSLLAKGLQNLDKDDFENKDNLLPSVLEDFKCPNFSTIKDNSLDKLELNQVSIKDINWETGRYTCVYSFLNSESFYTLKLTNKSLLGELQYLNNLKSIDNLPKNLELKDTYGLYQLDGINVNLSNQFQELDKSLSTAVKELKNNYKNQKIVNLNNVDSHTHFSKTFSSIFLGVVTTDPAFLESAAIDNNGNLNLKDVESGGVNKDGSASIIEDLDEQLTTLTDGLDKGFWGFYYYLIYNVKDVFNNLIVMLFGLGTIGIFGYAYVRKMTENENSRLDFNFTNKFIGVISALMLFSAPIIPSDKSIPSDFVYKDKSSSLDEEIVKNQTIISTVIRYMLQYGTFAANQLNDAALYSYLKHIGHNYSIFNPKGLNQQLNQDATLFIKNSVLLKHKLDFFERTCAYNYSNYLLEHQGLPGNINPVTIQFFEKDNKQGFEYVDYKTCSNLFTDLQQESTKNLIFYKKTVKKFEDFSNTLVSVKTTDVQELNNFLNSIVNINNKYGWISAAIVPSISNVLETKEILKYTVDLENNMENILDEMGELKSPTEKTDLKFTKNDKKAEDIGFFTKISKWFAGTADKVADPAFNFLENGTTYGISKALSFAIYYIFPFFSELFNLIKESGLVDKIFSSLTGAGSLFISTLNLGAGAIGSLVSDSVNVIQNLSNTFTGGILSFAITFMLTVFFYQFIISVLALIFISLLIILKIIFYFIDAIIAFFISTAVMLWSLVFDRQRAVSTVGEFFYKLTILAASPISIVLSVYVYMFSKAALAYLYNNLIELTFYISNKLGNDLDSHTLSGSFTGLQTWTIYNISQMIFVFVNVFLAYYILFNFHEKILYFFGHKGEGGAGKAASQVLDNLKHRALGKV